MTSSPAPTTPDNAPRRAMLNRSFTAPIKTSPATAKPPPEIGATEGVETLYTHPNASVVKFTTPASRPSSGSPSRSLDGGQALLPWTSLTERKMAAGPLHIYRVPGSVSFLNSGSLLHAILPRSQCWCVDGVSKFALRVLPDTYYRIELPGETEEDKAEVERLKLTLQKVCFYERTPCPFDRGYEAEIKDEVDLDVRGKRRKSHGPAKKWKLDRQYSWKPEGWQPGERRGSGDEGSGLGSSAGSEDESGSVSGQEDSGGEGKAEGVSRNGEQPQVTTPSRVRTAKTLLEQRSVTAPAAQLTLQSPPPSRLRTRVDIDGTVEVAEPAAVEGASEPRDSRTRTFQAIPTDMPPSPPDSSAGLDHAEMRKESSSEHLSKSTPETNEPQIVERQPDEGEAAKRAQGNVEDDNTIVIHESQFAADQSTNEIEATDEESRSDTPLEPISTLPRHEAKDGETPQATAEDDPAKQTERPHTPPTTHTAAERRSSDPFTEPKQPQQAAKPPSSTSSSPSKSSPSKPSFVPDDPFAAIQARILARRSIGGTTSFHPPRPPTTRQSFSSSSVSSTISRRSHSSSHQHQQAFATAMVKKACSVFLGPPAHLVAIMLRIAARFAKGAFGVDSVFYVESPAGARGGVPGSYQVWANGEIEGAVIEDDEELEEWEEDDFGVPLRGPVRLGSQSSLRSGSGEGLRGRRGWDVD